MLLYLHDFVDYVQELLAVVYELREEYPTYKEAEKIVTKYESNIPQPLASNFKQQEKSEIIEKQVSRFANRRC